MRNSLVIFLVALTGHCAGIQFNTTDPNVRAWRYDSANTSSLAAHSATISSAGYLAATKFILNIKRWGLRTQITQCQLYIGNELAACASPIINDGAYSVAVNNFVSGDFSQSTGLT